MRLGVDVGASHIVAVISHDDGRTETLPSIGRDRTDDALRLAAERAPGATTVLAHPPGWDPPRCRRLAEAAARAGLPGVNLVPAPVAAAWYITGALGHHVADGQVLAVGDALDISLVRRAGADWEVLATVSLDDADPRLFADGVAGVFLMGAARPQGVPGVEPVTLEEPELVVARGSLLAPAVPLPVLTPVPPAPPAVPLPPGPVPPPLNPFPGMPARHRRFPPWLVVPLGVVLVLGLVGTVADPGGLRAGLLDPLDLEPVLVLVMLLLVTASTGPKPMAATPFDPDMPSYKALGPALLVAAGTVATVVVLGLIREAADAGLVARSVFTALALPVVAGLIYLLARPAVFGAVEVPRSPRRRRSWITRWVLAGAALGLGSGAPPPPGASPAWWLAFPLGLVLTIGAWLLVAAALRPWVAGRPRRRTAALALALLVTALLLFVTITARHGSPLAGHPWWYLAAVLAVIAGVTVPSIRRSVRSVY